MTPGWIHPRDEARFESDSAAAAQNAGGRDPRRDDGSADYDGSGSDNRDDNRDGRAVHLSIVIPAYNEAQRIGATLTSLSASLSEFPFHCEVIVVDDGSADDTVAVAESIPMAVPLRVLREPHRGKGGAVRAGMLAAKGRYRMLFDADASMPPSEIPLFLEEADRGTPVVIGSREAMGAQREGESWLRNVRGRVFNGWVRFWAVPGVVDTQCGFKLFHREAAELIFSNTSTEGFAFDVEALLIARRAGFAIRELPIHWVHDQNSTVRPVLDSLLMAFSVVGIRMRHLGRSYGRAQSYQLHGASRSH